MDIVAPDARLGYGSVRIDRAKIPVALTRNDSGVCTLLICQDFSKACFFEFVRRTILFIDGPETDQPVVNPGACFCREVGGLP